MLLCVWGASVLGGTSSLFLSLTGSNTQSSANQDRSVAEACWTDAQVFNDQLQGSMLMELLAQQLSCGGCRQMQHATMPG